MVLPTPPEPQHTTMARSATSSDSRSPLAAEARGTGRTGAAPGSGGHRRAAAPLVAGRARLRAARPGRRRRAAGGRPRPGARPAVELGGPDPGAEEERGLELRQGELRGAGGPAARPGAGRAGPGTAPRPRSAPAWSSVKVTPTSAAASSGSRSSPGSAGRQALTMTGPSEMPDPVLEGVGGLDDLVDRHLLGQGDQGHLAAVGVATAARRRRRPGSAPGPTGPRPSRPWAEDRKVMAWPVAGASTRIRSAAPWRSRLFTLPRTRMSRMPGMAVATTSRAPERHQALGDPLHPVVGEVLEQGVVGGDPPGPDRAAARAPTRTPESWASS